ncbi:MAG: asparaginase [Agitococcus sp.]|nr:asparaginase [Agitococcus sp.]
MRVCIIYTGGTIGCLGNPLAPMSSDAFYQAFHSVITAIIKTKHAEISISFSNFATTLDSTNIQPSDWCLIASEIVNYYADYDAFIVLHGTDTMTWTASALSFLLTGLNKEGQIVAALDKPVIVTGSQLPLFAQQSLTSSLSLYENTDALNNIYGAISAVYAGIKEVGVYFHQQLLRGNRSLKTNTHAFDAFSSPNYPALGQHDSTFAPNHRALRYVANHSETALSHPENIAILKNQLVQINRCIDENMVINVAAYPVFYSQQSNVLAHFVNSAISIPYVKGIILQSYGAGSFPSGSAKNATDGMMYQALKAASEQNIVIVNCTQVITGLVNANSYEAGSWLCDVNAVDAKDMAPIAALTKLTVLLAVNHGCNYQWSPKFIGALMLTDLAGEITQ